MFIINKGSNSEIKVDAQYVVAGVEWVQFFNHDSGYPVFVVSSAIVRKVEQEGAVPA